MNDGAFMFPDLHLENLGNGFQQVTMTLQNKNSAGHEEIRLSVRIPAGNHTLSELERLAVSLSVALLQAQQELRHLGKLTDETALTLLSRSA